MSYPKNSGQDARDPDSDGARTSHPQKSERGARDPAGARTSYPKNSGQDACDPDSDGSRTSCPQKGGQDACDPDSDGSRTSCPQKSERDARDPKIPLHKHWHSRGYLPHCDTPGLLQSITFRLADSLPADALKRLLQETADAEKSHRIDVLLDAGHGACWLKQPGIADIVENALLHWDGQRYQLLAWCIMPNHVHILIETRDGWPLSELLQGWKSYTAKAINRHLGRTGTVWMTDYFDRYIRDDSHLAAVVAYIHGNPVNAGLVHNEQDWLHSSARLIGSADILPANCGRDVRDPLQKGSHEIQNLPLQPGHRCHTAYA